MNKSLWQKAWPHFAAIGIFLLVAIAYNSPALEGKVLQQSDITQWKAMAQQSFEVREKTGRYPLWTNSAFAGMPAYQIAMEGAYKYNPTVSYLHYVFTLGLPKPINYFFLTCLTMYFLLTVLRASPWIGVLTGICYAYSTFNTIIIAVGHDTQMSTLAYAPAVLAGLSLLFQKRYLWGTLSTAVFSGMLISQTHLQIVYYTFIMALFAGIAFLVHTIRKGDIRHAVITSVLAAVSGLAGLGINMSSLAPLNEFTKETMRGGRSELSDTTSQKNKTSGGLDKTYAFEYSYGRAETFTLLTPAIYGGGENGRQLNGDSKFAQKLTETFGEPEDRAIAGANGSLYWGDMPIQAGTVYVGAVVCFLFVLGLVLLRDWNKWWLLAVSIFGILLAWGSNFSWLNYFLFEHLPYYNKFRAPSMALFIPQLTFPLMAGLALQQLFFGDTSREELWKKLKLAGIITGAVLLVLVIMYFSSDYSGSRDAQLKNGLSSSLLQGLSRGQQPTPQVQQQAEELSRGMMSGLRDDRRSLFGKDLLRSIVLIGIAFGLLWSYVMQKLKKREYVLAGLLVLGVFDLLQVDHRYLSSDNYTEAEQSQDNFPATAADLQIKKDTGYYRVLDQSGGNPFVDPRASYFHNSLGGYSPAKLGLYQDIIEHQLRKSNMQVYNMLNTKYFIVQNPANGQPMAQENPGALGAAWFVKSIVFARNADDEMRRLDNLDTKDTAVIDERFKPKVTAQPVYDSTASIHLEWNKNDSIQYVSTSPTPQFAVFSEIYYPYGWNAYIDGKETDHVRVNYVLRGMPIPAGRHTIDFRFEPKTYYTGNKISLWVNILMCLLLLGGIGISVWKKKT